MMAYFSLQTVIKNQQTTTIIQADKLIGTHCWNYWRAERLYGVYCGELAFHLSAVVTAPMCKEFATVNANTALHCSGRYLTIVGDILSATV